MSPRAATSTNGLSDFSDVVSLEISTGGVRELSNICLEAATRHPDPVVAIVGSQDVIFGLARMFEALSQRSPWEISVFRDRREAVDWIRTEVRERFGMDVLGEDELDLVLPPIDESAMRDGARS